MPHSGSLPAARVPFQLLLRAQRRAEVGLRIDPDASPDQGTTSARDALSAFQEALQDDPNEADYHYMMGETLLRLGRAAEALPALREAARLQPENATYHDVLGCAFWEEGEFEDAYGAFAEAVRVAPDPQASLDGLAASLLQLDRAKEALEVLHRAQRGDRRDGRLYNNLGVALWELGKRGEAMRAFRRGVELSPESVSIRRNLGHALVASGEKEAALAVLRDVLRLRPNDAAAHADLGDLFYALGRRAEAEAAFDDALRIDPTGLSKREASRQARDAVMMERLKRELRAETEAARPTERAIGWLLGWAPSWVPSWRAMSLARRAVAAAGTLLFVLVLGKVALTVVPPYVTRFLLKDRLAEVARAPVRDDRDVLGLLMHEVEAQGLQGRIGPESCEITTLHQWRRITCRYDVTLRFLPGVQKDLRFEIRVEQPYFPKEPES